MSAHKNPWFKILFSFSFVIYTPYYVILFIILQQMPDADSTKPVFLSGTFLLGLFIFVVNLIVFGFKKREEIIQNTRFLLALNFGFFVYFLAYLFFIYLLFLNPSFDIDSIVLMLLLFLFGFLISYVLILGRRTIERFIYGDKTGGEIISYQLFRFVLLSGFLWGVPAYLFGNVWNEKTLGLLSPFFAVFGTILGFVYGFISAATILIIRRYAVKQETFLFLA